MIKGVSRDGRGDVFPFWVELFAVLWQGTDTRQALGRYLAWHQELQKDGYGEPVEWVCFSRVELPENNGQWQFLTLQRKGMLLHGIIPRGFLLQTAQGNRGKKPFWQREIETENLSALNKKANFFIKVQVWLILFICLFFREQTWLVLEI